MELSATKEDYYQATKLLELTLINIVKDKKQQCGRLSIPRWPHPTANQALYSVCLVFFFLRSLLHNHSSKDHPAFEKLS